MLCYMPVDTVEKLLRSLDNNSEILLLTEMNGQCKVQGQGGIEMFWKNAFRGG